MRTGKTILGALNYNENKVSKGDAECIEANMFGRELESLRFNEKKNRFQDQMRLNRRSKTNVVHISLNFAMNEKLDKATLRTIANTYMDKIGFSNQPYLVYNHFDAAHPHIHILTTSIQDNGKRIPLHNIGKLQSEKARIEIEHLFNLTKAQGKSAKQEQHIDPKVLKQALYGKSETKETISRIVGGITKSYKFTSIPELNAVLSQYNVIADRGKEGTVMHQKKGLVYCMLDHHGKKIGVPIKASSIYGKPTLANLEKKFKLNETLRISYRPGLQKSIGKVISGNGFLSLNDFISRLEKESLKVIFRQNAEGRVYGITFIDNLNRVVFNGSDLGKEYSAKAIVERLSEIPNVHTTSQAHGAQPKAVSDTTYTSSHSISAIELAIRNLTEADTNNYSVAPSFKKRKKRKKRSL